jgi:hypothetical protein
MPNVRSAAYVAKTLGQIDVVDAETHARCNKITGCGMNRFTRIPGNRVISTVDYSIARAATEFVQRQESSQTAAYHQETFPFIRFLRGRQIERRRCGGPTGSTTTNSRRPSHLPPVYCHGIWARNRKIRALSRHWRRLTSATAVAGEQAGAGNSSIGYRVPDTGRCRHGSARGVIRPACPSPAAATPHGPISCRAVTLDSSPGLPF